VYPESKTSLALLLAVGLSLGALACQDDKKQAVTEPDPEPEVTEDNSVIPSNRPRVKFKSGQRYVNDLSRALELPRLELCQELGLYDCVDEVHNITLGGVEPYAKGIREPLPVAPVTAPIAADRVALSACDKRAAADFEDPSGAVLFAEVAQAGAQAGEEDYQAVSRRLYEVILAREPEDFEVQNLAAFTAEVREEVGADRVPRQWSTMSCFMVATSMEALFY
jgi:hypothetical protein